MSILLIGLFIIIGIVSAVLLVFLILVIKLKLTARKYGYSNLGSLIDELRRGVNDSFDEIKSIGSQTQLLLPSIARDFPNFSHYELFNKVETSLRLIFNSLEEKCVGKQDELVLIRENLKAEIEDMASNNTSVRYDDIKFHKHGIKSYTKKDGVATIVVNTSLEYNYEKIKNGKIVNNNKGHKKQDRIETKFIYVYDPDDYSKSQVLVGITCPNCGAPVKELGNKKCRYCNSGLEDINLKSWHIISYKSDY